MLTRGLFVLAAVLVVAAPAVTVATEVTFEIDPLRSNVTLLADILGVRWFEQFPDSDTASYSGTITADVDDVFAPTQIEILGASAAGADYPIPMLPDADVNNVTFDDPGNPAPAVHGLMMTDDGTPTGVDTGFVALRNVELSVTTNDDEGNPVVEPIDGSGDFSSLSLEFEAVSAIADAWIIFFDPLQDDLAGETFRNDDPLDPPEGGPWPETMDSSYVVEGNTATLTIAVNSHTFSSDFRDMYEGFLVGTFELAPPFNEADFDRDGDVDGDDFLLWQTGFGTPSGAAKMDGDFDNDGDVDGDDFLGWQANFGSGDGAGSVAVPEPTSLFLAWAALSGAAALFRRRRH